MAIRRQDVASRLFLGGPSVEVMCGCGHASRSSVGTRSSNRSVEAIGRVNERVMPSASNRTRTQLRASIEIRMGPITVPRPRQLQNLRRSASIK